MVLVAGRTSLGEALRLAAAVAVVLGRVRFPDARPRGVRGDRRVVHEEVRSAGAVVRDLRLENALVVGEVVVLARAVADVLRRQRAVAAAVGPVAMHLDAHVLEADRVERDAHDRVVTFVCSTATVWAGVDAQNTFRCQQYDAIEALKPDRGQKPTRSQLHVPRI